MNVLEPASLPGTNLKMFIFLFDTRYFKCLIPKKYHANLLSINFMNKFRSWKMRQKHFLGEVSVFYPTLQQSLDN